MGYASGGSIPGAEKAVTKPCIMDKLHRSELTVAMYATYAQFAIMLKYAKGSFMRIVDFESAWWSRAT